MCTIEVPFVRIFGVQEKLAKRYLQAMVFCWVGPVGPVEPVGPVRPVRPVRRGPSGPLGPVEPVGPVGPVGPDVGAVGQSCCMRFLEGDLVGIVSRSSKIPDFVEVLARRSCGYPSEILCCRGVCEEILRTSCWNLLKDICVKI